MRAELREQSAFLARVRDFFKLRGVLEVHTPSLRAYTVLDPNVASLSVWGRQASGYLQTSPEVAMKVLLAEGSGDIYHIAHAFRDDALGPWHRPEFLMLEWYRLGWDEGQLLAEVRALCEAFLPGSWSSVSVTDWLIGHGWRVDDPDAWSLLAKTFGLVSSLEHPHDVLDFLIQACVHAHRTLEWVVYCDFPSVLPGHAAESEGRQKRFELYYGALEIANGCCEERTPEKLEAVFSAQQAQRALRGEGGLEVDPEFMDASRRLPVVSGVAVGLDRLYTSMKASPSLASLLNLRQDGRVGR